MAAIHNPLWSKWLLVHNQQEAGTPNWTEQICFDWRYRSYMKLLSHWDHQSWQQDSVPARAGHETAPPGFPKLGCWFSGWDCTRCMVTVNSLRKSHVIVTRGRHWWRDLFLWLKSAALPWCSHYVQYCTMTKHWRGLWPLSFSIWIETFFPLWVSFETSLSITEHGYLLWHCHVWLKKKWKINICLNPPPHPPFNLQVVTKTSELRLDV